MSANKKGIISVKDQYDHIFILSGRKVVTDSVDKIIDAVGNIVDTVGKAFDTVDNRLYGQKNKTGRHPDKQISEDIIFFRSLLSTYPASSCV